MHGMISWSATPVESPRVMSAISVGKHVTIHFGDDVTVWLRPSEAELLARDLKNLLDELAAA